MLLPHVLLQAYAFCPAAVSLCLMPEYYSPSLPPGL